MNGREVHAWAAIDVYIRELLAIKATWSRSSMDALLFLGRELQVLGDDTQSKSYLHVDGCVDAMLVGVDGSRDRVSIYNAGSFEHVLNPLSAFTSMQDSVFDNKDLGRFYSGGGRRICLVAERDAPDAAALRVA